MHHPLNHSVQQGGQFRQQQLTLFIINYAVLQDVLKEINREGKDEYTAKAHGDYINQMDMFYVYFGLKLSHLLISTTEQLSITLQGNDTTILENLIPVH